ncbi:adipocyte plasma membrane-associated protein-like [Bolinopsis microptera]|uniref:adipocyte plasma membrane-associated protein-like n=1 Tax=Bolinopsis microptera TaxID=2820187 RepID=UPI00307AFE51
MSGVESSPPDEEETPDEMESETMDAFTLDGDSADPNYSSLVDTITTRISSASSVCKRSVQLISLLLVVMIAVIVSYSPPIRPVTFRMPPAPKLTGPLTENNRLRSTQQILKSRIVGPESIAIGSDGTLYTGLANGKIVSVRGKVITEIGYTGHVHCSSEETCGRPLGVRIHNESLYVINAYKGILKVSLNGDSQQMLVNMKDESIRLNNRQTRFLNDLDISSAGVIYFTDSSSRHSREYNIYEFLEAGPHGTLFSYNMLTHEIKVLISGLHFPNGVQLAPDESYVLVAECTRARIVRYWLRGELTGTWDYFAVNLPGYPDNIRRRESGGYWLGMAAIRRHPFSLVDSLAPYPQVRATLTKILPYFLLRSLASQYGMVVVLDEFGNIMDSLQDPGGLVIPSSSEIAEHDGVLYIGSYYSSFIGKLRLKDEF